ncbi:thioredoxin domain-containing protein 17-like [Planococcus citri]|uniref:thioredoxin domain-containing protein 17-like n=1 Tax=Planococcus citri TaxID=170843 RepID=UPI0031F8C81F
MVERYSATSYNEWVRQILRLSETHQRIVVVFCGALDENGLSWCPDCRNALPVIEDAIQNTAVPNVRSAYLFVGIQRDEWKNPNNYYKMDNHLKLTNVPTIICWDRGKLVARLVEEDCAIPEMVSPLFKNAYL